MNFADTRFAEFLEGLSPNAPTGSAMAADKRRAARVHVRNRVTITLCGGGGAPTSLEEVELRDFSPRGVRFVRQCGMTVGEQFIFHAPQRSGPPVQILCTVAHCRHTPEGEIAIGAEFTCVLTNSAAPAGAQADAQTEWIRKRMMD